MEALSQTNYKYGASGADAGRSNKSTAHFRHPKNSSSAVVAPGTQPRPVKPKRDMRSLGSAKQLAFGHVRASMASCTRCGPVATSPLIKVGFDSESKPMAFAASAGELTSVTRDSGMPS